MFSIILIYLKINEAIYYHNDRYKNLNYKIIASMNVCVCKFWPQLIYFSSHYFSFLIKCYKTHIFGVKLFVMKKYYLFLNLILFTLIYSNVKAQQLSPQASISILTCNPGTEVYSMYGHSAIRVKDPTNGIDVVFNYGLFSFDSPHFIYRFAKGQTDYMMGAQRFSSWLPEYEEEKRSVYEQILNLPPEEKNNLFNALVLNAKPENRVYRYNFFYDNCSTRVRDMIERNIGEEIVFPNYKSYDSFRHLIKEYHHSFRWLDVGIDLLVGRKADDPISTYEQMFLPEYLMKYFAKAKIIIGDKTEPLVLETRTLLEYPNSKQNYELPWPTIIFGLLFIIVFIASIWAYRHKKSLDWLDYSLLTLSGIIGLIISWLMIYSEHPSMSFNLNVLWAFPLNIFFVGVWTIKKRRAQSNFYFIFSGSFLSLSVMIGQIFNPAVYFFILILLVRIVANLVPARDQEISTYEL